jgi:hypothetical protein
VAVNVTDPVEEAIVRSFRQARANANKRDVRRATATFDGVTRTFKLHWIKTDDDAWLFRIDRGR